MGQIDRIARLRGAGADINPFGECPRRDEAMKRGTVLWDGRRDQTKRMGGRSSGARTHPAATSTGHQCQVAGAQARPATIEAAGTGTPIMKMQPTSVMQAGVMPLQGMGAVSGAPPGAAMIISMPAGMAIAGMTRNVDAPKNATANRMANRRLRG
jgi:hypothetical protein